MRKSKLNIYRLSVSTSEFEIKESARALQMQRQKVVYHMILACVPPEARSAITVTTALPAKDHTGSAAWKALRAFFIGNEYAYLQSLETRFLNIVWGQGDSNETFPAFEARFETLLSELETAGVGEAEHVKKFALIRAVEMSTKKDSDSTFYRLHTTAKIRLSEEKPYREWLTAIRTEAQQIQDAMNIKSSQASRDTKRKKISEDEAEQNVRDVSFISSANSSSSSFSQAVNSQSRRAFQSFIPKASRFDSRSHKPLCRNFQSRGRCRFGVNGKFIHAQTQTGTQNNSYNNNYFANNRNVQREQRSSQDGFRSQNNNVQGGRNNMCFVQQFCKQSQCSRRTKIESRWLKITKQQVVNVQGGRNNMCFVQQFC